MFYLGMLAGLVCAWAWYSAYRFGYRQKLIRCGVVAEITFTIAADTAQTLDTMAETIGGTRLDVFSYSLALAQLVLDQVENGGALYIHQADGTPVEVRIHNAFTKETTPHVEEDA